MPGTKKTEKKELYIAKSMGQLNQLAELPAKMKTTNAKLLVKTADKMLKEAEHSEMLHDEERAYVLFMKYFNVVSYLKKTADYKKQKTFYDDLLGQKNLLLAIDKAEELSSDLKERYDRLEAEAVAQKLSSLDEQQTDKEEKKKDDVKPKEEKDKEKGQEIVAEEKAEKKGSITCQTLFGLLGDKDTQIVIMDVRPASDYLESHISDKSCISIPAESVPPGTTVTYIEKQLPSDSLSLWKQRGNVDLIILLDRNSTVDQLKIGTPLQTLKDALFKYDSTVIIKSEPLVLEGGYDQWMLHYPTHCINPDFQRLNQPISTSSQDSLMDFDYPDFEQAFLMTPSPTRPANQKPVGEESGQSASSMNGDIHVNQSGGGARPLIDRTTKPKPASVSDVKVEPPSLKSSGSSGKLYPDVRSISSTSTNRNKVKTDQSASLSKKPDQSSALGSLLSSTLSSTSSDLEKELAELEKEKKRKLDELSKMQREHERIRLEEKARIEKMKEEEKRLSVLEEMRRKEQSDVADLLRKKKSLQADMKREKENQEKERIMKEQEEKERMIELERIQNEEEEKKRRQDEVMRLRMDRKIKEEEEKKKEEENAEKEREREAARAVLEAQERARQEEEQRQRELRETEERVARMKQEEEQRRRQEEEKRNQQKQIEEKIKQQKEKQAKLEQERQAALEEERRKRAEQDRIEAERREVARIEREKKERERQEREKREREEEDRKRAEEAKRVADEKLLRLNEENLKARVVPSPNLLTGWEKKLDPQTRRYFYIDHNRGTTQWEPPTVAVNQDGSTYTTKLKEEPKEPRSRGLQRSNSSPNIAKLFEDETQKPKTPIINRGNKPMIRHEAQQKPSPMPMKRRDLNPVYGNVGRALTGLRNLGNTCYMNSTIQCLNNTSPLVTYLLTDEFLWDINRESTLGSHGEVVDEFAFIVKALWTGQYRFITPRDFKSVVGRHQPMFAGYDQQDSQEFLTFLLDGLHEGLNKVKKRPRIPDQDNDNLPDTSAASIAWKNHKLLNESIIVELFQGQLKSTLMCLTCKKQSKTFQAFMYLSLPIPSSSRCSLQDCLRQFVREEKMTGSSRWRCPRCKVDRDSVKKIDIWKLPRILLIALNRFVYEGQWRNKISAHVDFPVRGLDLGHFVQGSSAQQYKLYGISNHFGTLDGGHYTAYCKNACTQKWYKYDDHEVYEMSESSIKTSAAYVLYYTSIELPPPDFRVKF